MTTTVLSIFDRVFELLNDQDQINYRPDQALRWLSEAQTWIAGNRADASSSIQTVPLVRGTKQSIPLGSHHLIRLMRNMGSTGTAAGDGIGGPISLEMRGRINRSWHTATVTSTYKVEDYSYEMEVPAVYWVSPPVPSGISHYVEAEFANNPTALTDINGNIGIADRYEGDLVTYVAMRFMSRDSELSPNFVRAQALQAQLERTFGTRIVSDQMAFPNDKMMPGNKYGGG